MGTRPPSLASAFALALLVASTASAQTAYLLKDINATAAGASSNPASFRPQPGGPVFFADDGIHGRELWKASPWLDHQYPTRLFADIFPGAESGCEGSRFTPYRSYFHYFPASDGLRGREVWSMYEGMPPKLLADVCPGECSHSPADLTSLDGGPGGDPVYFTADDGVHGRELWRPQGVLDIAPGSASSSPSGFIAAGSRLYFAADDGTSGAEVWYATGGETHLVMDINPGAVSSSPSLLTYSYPNVLFAASDGAHGVELWRSSVSDGSTVLVKDVAPGAASSSPVWVVKVDNSILFAADDGTHGTELWRTDLTETGTSMVKDISVGSQASITPRGGDESPVAIKYGPANNNVRELYFAAGDGINGVELWRSDGTADGTVLVADLCPGACSSDPQNFTTVDRSSNTNGDEIVFFSAATESAGRELWRTDGTPGGTFMIRDIAPGPAGSDPHELTAHANLLYFAAGTDTTGIEPYVTCARAPTAFDQFSKPNWVVTAGAPNEFQVMPRDAAWPYEGVPCFDGVVQVASGDPAAIFASEFVAVPGRYPTAEVKLRTLGSQAVTVSTDFATATWTVQVVPATTLTVEPSTLVADGQSTAQITLRCLDADGQPLTTCGTFNFVTIPTTTITNVVQQQGTVTATLRASTKAGSVRVYAVSGTVSISPDVTVTLTGGPVVSLAMTAPADVLVGTPFGITVSARDAFDNVTAYSGTIHWSADREGLDLPADYTFVEADGGSHVFNVTLPSAVTVVFAVDDVANANLRATRSVRSRYATTTRIVTPFWPPASSRVNVPFTVTASVETTPPGGEVTGNVLFTIRWPRLTQTVAAVNGAASAEWLIPDATHYTATAEYLGSDTTAPSTLVGGLIWVRDWGPATIAAKYDPTQGMVVGEFRATEDYSRVELFRQADGSGTSQPIAVVDCPPPAVCTYVDPGVEPDRLYLYAARAIDPLGHLSNFSRADPAITVTFTDTQLVAGLTPIKAVHINELRHAVAVLSRSNVTGSYPLYTHPTISPGDVVSAVDFTELLFYLQGRLRDFGLLQSYEKIWYGPYAAPGGIVQAAHWQALYNALP